MEIYGENNMKFLIQNIMLLTETTGWLSNIPDLEDYEIVAPTMTYVDFIFFKNSAYRPLYYGVYFYSKT